MSEWKDTTLGSLCLEGGGGIQTGPFGSQLHASDYVLRGVPVVMPQNIGDNVIGVDGIARIPESDVARLAKYRLREGDIVYSRRGDVEKRALVRQENDGWLCGTGCLRVRLGDRSVHNSAYVSYLLGTEKSRAWIVRHAVGATMPNLNTSILSAVPISVPDPSQQRAIAEVLGALDDKIAANTKLAATSTALLTGAFKSTLTGVGATNRPVEDLVTRLPVGRKFDKSELDAHNGLPVFDQSEAGILGYLEGQGFFDANSSHPVIYFGDHTCQLRIASEPFFIGPNTVPFVGRDYPSLVLFCALQGVQKHEEYKRHWQALVK
nr:restriction endonuclease subunit S [Acidobacteriota bacterium]